MRLLHTSDWHLGRSLHRVDLGAAQEAFVDHLVEVAADSDVDLVVVAGDVFDRAIPPLPAVALFESALRRLRAAGPRVVVTSGNHDSASRLGVNSGLIDAAGVHVRTRVGGLADPVLVEDRHGPVAIYAIPYLEPLTVHAGLEAPPTHVGVLEAATSRAAADLTTRGCRGVAVAHGWVAGGAATESERDITVGGVGWVPASLFEPFAYTALGHLHRPQQVAERMRYCGSPLPYSFSEAGHAKGSLLVEIGADGPGGAALTVETVPAPVHRPLAVIRGTMAELLTSSAHTAAERALLSVTLTDAVMPLGAMEQLRRRFPHVLQLLHEPVGAVTDDRTYTIRLSGRSDREIAADFVAHVRGADASAGECALLDEAFTAARLGDAGSDPSSEAETARVA